MPDGKWVSKANLQTFWQMIRSKVIPTMIGDTVTTWLTEHVDPVGSAVMVDDTLTIQGAAADAKKTGDEISGLKEDLNKDIYILKKITDSGFQSENKLDLSQCLYHKYVNNDGSITAKNSDYNYCVSNLIRVDPYQVAFFVQNGTAAKVRGYVGFTEEGTVAVQHSEDINYHYYNDNSYPIYVLFNLYIERAEDKGMILVVPYISSNMWNPNYIESYTKYLIPEYQKYKLEPLTQDQLIRTYELTNSLIDALNSNIIYPENLFDIINALLDSWMYTDGHITTGESYIVSDYIPVPSHKCVVFTARTAVASATRVKANVRNPIVFNQYKTKIAVGSDNKNYYYNDTNDFQYIRVNIANTYNDIMISYSDYNDGSPDYPNEYIKYGEIKPIDLMRDELLPRQKEMYKNETLDVVSSVLANTRKKNLVFTWVSDTHYDPTDMNNKRRTLDTFSNIHAVSERIYSEFIVHCGDFVISNKTGLSLEQSDGIINEIRSMMLKSFDKVFMVNGNHDGPDGGPPRTMNYNAIGYQNESYVARINNYAWFYSDDEIRKIRMIFLATNSYENSESIWGISNLQLLWIDSTLTSTPNDYSVMIFSHIGTFDEDFRTNRDAVCSLFNDFHNHNGKFSSKTGKCICWFCGHEHFDWIVPSNKSGVQFPQLVITASGLHAYIPDESKGWDGVDTPYPRTDGTTSQDAWDIVVYDQEQNILKTFRFGAGNNRIINLNEWDSTL